MKRVLVTFLVILGLGAFSPPLDAAGPLTAPKLTNNPTLDVIVTNSRPFLTFYNASGGSGKRTYIIQIDKSPTFDSQALVEYKKEAFDIFADLSDRVASEVVARLMKIQIAREERVRETFVPKPSRISYSRGEGSGGGKPQTVVKEKKVGRNDPCICGSGKKYKKCCGANA